MAGVAQGAGLDKAYHCYVISLAREPQRRSDFRERIRQTDLSVEVFDAIDGRGLVYDRCVQDGLVAPDADGYKRGRLGCASSHRALWREADRSGRNLLILEDDIYCRRDIAQQIPKILSHLKDWDIVLLGFNTNAVLSFKISEDCDFSGFFSNETPSVQQLEAFTREIAPSVPLRLNNAFGLCSYLLSPRGARKLLSLFPLSNRMVRIPGNKARFGKEDFRCRTLDMNVNTLYAQMNSYVAIPPLALPLNDAATSLTMADPFPHQIAGRPLSSAKPNFAHRLKKLGSRGVRKVLRLAGR